MAQMEFPPGFILNKIAQEISKVLADIYQDCINIGTMPSQ